MTAGGGWAAPQPAAQGRIYDLGYQPYEGPRQGRRRALVTLFRTGLKRAWGLGRPFRAKIAPWLLAAIALLPALIALGIAALIAEELSPYRYENYYGVIARIILLFCTVVAPELLCPDQRQRVLALYFSRGITRLDYVGARLAALVTALLLMCLSPQVFLFLGNTFVVDDVFDYLTDNLDILPRILGAALLISLYFSSIALAVAAHTNRRVWAAGGFIALMLVSTAVVSSVFATLENEPSKYLTLLAFSEAPIIATNVIFEAEPNSLAEATGLSPNLWLFASLAYTAAAIAILVRRYLKLHP